MLKRKRRKRLKSWLNWRLKTRIIPIVRPLQRRPSLLKKMRRPLRKTQRKRTVNLSVRRDQRLSHLRKWRVKKRPRGKNLKAKSQQRAKRLIKRNQKRLPLKKKLKKIKRQKRKSRQQRNPKWRSKLPNKKMSLPKLSKWKIRPPSKKVNKK